MKSRSFESGVQRSDPFSLSSVVTGLRPFPSWSEIHTSSRPERSEMNAIHLPSNDHFGDWLRDAMASGAMRVMSPRSVAMVRICPRAATTARRPEGERSKASTSLSTRWASASFSLSSLAMSSLISVVRPEATSSFQMPKPSS